MTLDAYEQQQRTALRHGVVERSIAAQARLREAVMARRQLLQEQEERRRRMLQEMAPRCPGCGDPHVWPFTAGQLCTACLGDQYRAGKI